MTFPPSKVSPGQAVTAAHYNALLDYVLRATPRRGRNVTLDETPHGVFINAQPGGAQAAGKELSPFTVRRHAIYDENGEETSAQWEIYLPAGCVAVRYSCQILNSLASADSEHEDDNDDWYALPWPDEEQLGRYNIVIHGKQRTRMKDENDELSGVSPRAFAGVERDGANPLVESETRGDYCGDTFSATVATVDVESDDKGGTVRTISQAVSAPIVVQGVPDTPFDLVWDFSPGEDGEKRPTLEGIACIRQHFTVAGCRLDGEEDDDALAGTFKDRDHVWLKIDTSGAEYAIEIVSSPEGDLVSTDDIAWVPLYMLAFNRVTVDMRSSLNQVPIYRNSSQQGQGDAQ